MIILLQGSVPCTHYNLTCMFSRSNVPISVPAKLKNPKHLPLLQVFLEEFDFNFFETFKEFLYTKKTFCLRSYYYKSNYLYCLVLIGLDNCHHYIAMH